MQEGFAIAPAWRYRCFGAHLDRQFPCPKPGKWRAPDERRHDALTFYCEDHRPKNAIPLTDDQPFLELAVPGLTILGGCTMRHQDAKVEAVFAIQSALNRLGARFVPADVRAALKSAHIILPGGKS